MVLFSYMFSIFPSINWWGKFHLLNNLLRFHKLPIKRTKDYVASLWNHIANMRNHDCHLQRLKKEKQKKKKHWNYMSVELEFIFSFRIVVGLLCSGRRGGYGITNMLTTFFSRCSLEYCILKKNNVTAHL
jgi:hypothetical protein